MSTCVKSFIMRLQVFLFITSDKDNAFFIVRKKNLRNCGKRIAQLLKNRFFSPSMHFFYYLRSIKVTVYA